MYPYFLFAAIHHLKSSPTFSVRPCSSVGRVTVDLIRRSWVRFPPRSKDFFFASCGSLFPFSMFDINAGAHEGACSCNTLPKQVLQPVHTKKLAPETRSRNMLPGKYPNQYTRGSLLLKHAPAKQISVHTRELAPETGSRKANFSTHEGASS